MTHFTNPGMDQCTHRLKFILILLLTLPFMALAQTKKITGTVKDATGQVMPGVTILIEGTSTKAQTDGDGKFSITAKPGDVLVAKYISHTDGRVTVDQRTNYTITIKEEANSLTDVVVIGFGTQKRSSIAGSVATIDKKVLANRPVTNTVEALQGNAPGLVVTRSSGQPGNEKWNLNIRGFSSINGTNQPLIIVDGIEYADLSKINPNDIENISVLKDGAAAIYGAKSAGGVVLVTTKKGAIGKVRVNYSGLLNIKTPIALPKRLNSWEEAALQNLGNFNNNGGAPTWSEQQIAWMKDPNQSFQPNDPTGNTFYYYNEDYIGASTKKSFVTTNQNVDISGGNENTQYFFGLGYVGNSGFLKYGPDASQRYNARLNLNTKFNKTFSLDSRLAFTQNNIKQANANVYGDYSLLYNIFNLRRIYPIYVPGSNNTKYVSGAGATTIGTLKEGGQNNSYQQLLDATFTLKAENLAKGLVLSVVYSPHIDQMDRNQFSKTVPTYTWNKASQEFVQNSFINQTNNVVKSRTKQISYSTNALADYTLELGDHHFKALGGFQYQYYNYDGIYARKSALLNNDLASLNYTTVDNLPINYVGDNIQTNVWVSLFGRLNYDYKNKYYLEATVRNDASSQLSTGNKDQTFPGILAAWRISQESWFSDNVKFVNELKLRASYGKLGNAQLSEYLYEKNYESQILLSNGIYPFNGSATPFIFQGSEPSPSIGWESITTYNIGLDATFFNNRLTTNFDFYKKKNEGMLYAVPVPAVLGINPTTTNAATMKNTGWEVNANWNDKIGEFGYNFGFNLSDNKDQITKLGANSVYGEGLNKLLLGQSINSIYGYKSLGYFQSDDEVTNSPKQFGTTLQGPGDIKYADLNGDGKIDGGLGTETNHGDLTNLGSTSPRYSFGINLGASWKGFDFSAFLQGVGKRNMILYPRNVIPFIESWRYPFDNYRDNYWTPENRDAQFPRPLRGGGTNTRVNSAFVQNAAYIRLKNIQLGYTLPKSWINKAKIENVRVFFSGQDIWTATKMWYKYFDPENPNNASYAYPFMATYAFGLNVTF